MHMILFRLKDATKTEDIKTISMILSHKIISRSDLKDLFLDMVQSGNIAVVRAFLAADYRPSLNICQVNCMVIKERLGSTPHALTDKDH